MAGRTWQDIPDWVIFSVRFAHHDAKAEGRQRAGSDAIAPLAARILAEDPGFARVIVEQYVRTLIRAPKPRRRKKTGERELLMADCVRLSAEGQSLRAIGQAKGISHTTVRKLIAEWQTRFPEMPAEIVRVAIPVETASVNPQNGGFTAQVSSDPNVIPLRRPA